MEGSVALPQGDRKGYRLLWIEEWGRIRQGGGNAGDPMGEGWH